MEGGVRVGLAWLRLLGPTSTTRLVRLSTRTCATTVNRYNDRDPAPVFFNKNVQEILKKINELDFNKVFRQRFDGTQLKPPRYEFLTNEELEEHFEKSKKASEKILQMPPVVKERQPILDVLSKDPGLTGYDTCKYVFTDITYGLSDRKRPIVVRDPDGTLRKASWEERERMNQIYNPRPGRKLKPHKLFLEEHLQGVLEREKYEFVLDCACAQFEPDDPEYQRVTSTVYETVEARRHYHMLNSTRHYGPMCFYLAWHKKIDNLLISLLQKEKLEACADMVKLHQLIHTDCKTTTLNVDPNQHLDFLKAYIEHGSLQRPQLLLAMQAYQDIVREREQYEKDVRSAHGV
nr:28S ribosomal protein S22, mitochondrial-like [Procambarus clarkii]